MVSIRLAAPKDFEFFYQLKCEPSNIFWTGFDTPPERTSFQKWYERIIQNQGEKTNRKIYIIMDNDTPVGHIYIEPSGSDVFDIPMAISEKYWGHGYGKAAARLALEEAALLVFDASLEKSVKIILHLSTLTQASALPFPGTMKCTIFQS